MGGMARRGEAREPDHGVPDDADVLLGHGRQLAPQLVERVAVQPPRARLEPARVDDVRRPDLGDVHRELRMLAHERPGGAGVVEVDVGEEEVPEVADLHPAGAERVA